MRIALLALVLAGCASDPWPGRYEGTTTTEQRECTGAALPTDTQATTVGLERTRTGELVLNGRCLVELREINSMTATFVPLSCDVALSDGTPARYDVVNGRAQLDGDRLELEYSAQVTTPDACITGLATFRGFRVE